MLVQILDGNGQPHTVAWQGQDQINDASGNLQVATVGPPAVLQQVLAANVNRAGWLFQNTSTNAMLLQELSAGGTLVNTWVINSGQMFPPCGYPIPTGAISVGPTAQSQAGDTFTCREWINGPGE